MKRDVPYIPRFFIDELQYKTAVGKITEEPKLRRYNGSLYNYPNTILSNFNDTSGNPPENLVDLDCTEFYKIDTSVSDIDILLNSGHSSREEIDGTKKYIAILGHTLKRADANVWLGYGNFTWPTVNFENTFDTSTMTEIINWAGANEEIGPHKFDYNGFSIAEFDSTDYIPTDTDLHDSFSGLRLSFQGDDGNLANYNTAIGSISYGTIYDMPVPADLQMSISYEFGHSTVDAPSGKTFINRKWFQKPKWVNYQEPWSLDENINSSDTSYFDSGSQGRKHNASNLRKAGRRVYTLTFSYLSDDDMFATNPVNSVLGMQNSDNLGDTIDYIPTDSDNNNINNTIDGTDDELTLYNDNSFFAQLVQKTAGFSIPFIFQPNKNYARPDGFMLAIVNQESLVVEQIGVNLFRTTLEIKEIW